MIYLRLWNLGYTQQLYMDTVIKSKQIQKLPIYSLQRHCGRLGDGGNWRRTRHDFTDIPRRCQSTLCSKIRGPSHCHLWRMEPVRCLLLNMRLSHCHLQKRKPVQCLFPRSVHYRSKKEASFYLYISGLGHSSMYNCFHTATKNSYKPCSLNIFNYNYFTLPIRMTSFLTAVIIISFLTAESLCG